MEKLQELSSNLELDVKISWCQKPTACSRSAVIFGFSVLEGQQNKYNIPHYLGDGP
jgi:hypothetical protein